MSSVSGTGGSIALSGPNYGRMFLHLIPRKNRKLSADELINQLRPKLNVYPEVDSLEGRLAVTGTGLPDWTDW